MWADVIAEFAVPGGLTVTRTAAGTLSGGFYTEGSTSSVPVATASIQPASGKDMQLFPEGARAVETIRIYTTTRMLTAEAPDGTYPDTFSWDGKSWEVKMEQPWQLNNVGYFKFLAQRIAG